MDVLSPEIVKTLLQIPIALVVLYLVFSWNRETQNMLKELIGVIKRLIDKLKGE